jgi:hypothetical protein
MIRCKACRYEKSSAPFRFFDLLLGTTNPGLKRSRWTFEGVGFTTERHNFTGSAYGFTFEIFRMEPGPSRLEPYGCQGIVVDWRRKTAKTHRARPLAGKRSDIMGWLQAQEAELERSINLKSDR